LQPENPSDLIEKVKLCGIKAIQLALVPLVEERTWHGSISTFKDEKIDIVSGMLETVGEDYSTLETIEKTGGLRPDSTWHKTLERATRVATIAAEMGLELVTFHAGFLQEESCSERNTMLARLETLGDIFGDHSIQLALETGQEDAHTLLGVLEELSHPMIGVNFDPANMILYGKGDPIEALERLKPWVKQVHIKDAIPSQTKGEWGFEVPVGEGEVDWRSFLKHVPEDVNLVIERESGKDRVRDIQGAIQLLKRIDE
jgi:L-ribulose-5-phosphate 3-epimerase